MFALATVALALAQSPYPGDPPQLEESRALLAEGRPFEAFDTAELGLEYAPDHVELLIAAAMAAEAGNDGDAALWYSGLALTRAGDAEEHAGAVRELRAILAELDPLDGAAGELFDGYAGEVFELGRSLYKAKLYLNAVDMYSRCEGTVAESEAREQLERVYENKRAVEALLESGADVPIEPPRKRTAQWVAKFDHEHADWENAAELEGVFYTVVTNMGYELGERMLAAMEQMNRLYRDVFQYKQRGGSMARCVVYVYRTRDEYLAAYPDKELEGTGGFFQPGANYVATYDPRTAPWPGTIDTLWATLFHEASHQFTRAVSKNPIPAWLNEGTASYFEGARLLPNGTVRTNLIPEGRLRALVRALDEGSPTLREVVGFSAQGSYPGEFYAVGWGLVYFLHNWEDEESQRVYVPVYREYLESYKSGGQHDRTARWIEYFVERAGVPGIESFDDFRERFESWARDLHELHFGPPENADRLLERAARQLEHGELDAAAESYRRALDKRPRDARAFLGLARVLDRQKKKDAALLNYRRVLEIARDSADPAAPLPSFEESAGETAKACLERVTKLHRVLGMRMTESDEAFAARAGETARAYFGEDFPRTSLRLLSDSLDLLGGHGDLRAQVAAITEETGFDLRRWRRLPITPELEYWWADEEDFSHADGALAGEPSGDYPVFAFYRERLPDEYLFEVTVNVDERGERPAAGLIYGPSSPRGMQVLLVGATHVPVATIYGEEGMELIEFFDPLPRDARDRYRLGVRHGAGEVELFVDGHSMTTLQVAPGEISGSPGLLVQDAKVRFSDARVLY